MSSIDSLEFLIDLSQNSLFKKNIHNGLKDALDSHFPSDIVAKCNGRLHVCVTKVWPDPVGKETIINNFKNRHDLFEVLAASCFIPFYSAPSAYATIGRERYVDGGLYAFIPPIGDIRISPIPIPSLLMKTSRKAHIQIISKKYATHQLIRWVLFPPSPVILRDLFDEGVKSAEFWVRTETIKKQLSLYSPPNRL
jgi:hypothetical protein